MKTAVVFLVVAVYGISGAFVPSLNTIKDKIESDIKTTHHIKDTAIKVADSTQKGVAEISKDAAQKTEMVVENVMEIGADEIKAAIRLGQDKTNQMLDAVKTIGGPIASIASIGSKLTNLTAQAGETITDANTGIGQLVAAEVNEGVGTAINAASKAASAVNDKIAKVNDLKEDVALTVVDLSAQAVSNVGNAIAKGFTGIGNAIGNWAKPSSTTKNVKA